MGNEIEKQRKAKLKARSAYDWMIEMHTEYLKKYNQPDDFTIDGDNIVVNKNALDFCVSYQTEHSRSMNPETRKYLKTFLKNFEKQLT